MEKEKAKPLEEILREQFAGTFLLRAIPHGKGTRFIHVGADSERQKMIEAGIDEYSTLFNVAAFRPKVGSEYACLVRQRDNAHIAEVVPYGYLHMAGNEWHNQANTNSVEVQFAKNGSGRFSARHPDTGQFVLPHRNLTIPDDGKFAPGTLELRPTLTRTFWVAGAPGTLKELSANALDIFDEENAKPDDFSYAREFLFMGTYYTAFEAMGNPFAGIVETDVHTLKEIVEFVQDRGRQLEIWVAKNLLPVVHPDAIEVKYKTSKMRDQIMAIADETRYNILEMCAWIRNYSEWWVQEVRQLKAVGGRSLPEIPKPYDITGRRRKRRLLMSLSRADIERMLEPKKPRTQASSQTKPMPATSAKPQQTKDKKTPQPPATPAAPGRIPSGKGKVEPHIAIEPGRTYVSGDDSSNTIGDILNGKSVDVSKTAKQPKTPRGRKKHEKPTGEAEIPLDIPVSEIKKRRRRKTEATD